MAQSAVGTVCRVRVVLVVIVCAAFIGGTALASSDASPQPPAALRDGVRLDSSVCRGFKLLYYTEEGYPICEGPPDPADAPYDEFSGPEAPEGSSDPGVPPEETYPSPDTYYVDGHPPTDGSD